MKNMVKFLGIIAFAAVIVFSMIGCGEDNSNDKNNQSGSVAGTWSWTGTGTVNSDGKVYGISSFTIIFNNDNTFEIKQYITTVDGNPSWNGYMMAKGTYTVDGNKITITQLQHSENEGVSWSDTVPPVVIGGITFTSTNISFPSAITTITLTKQTSNNNEPDNGSINFSDAKWSNITVYNRDGSTPYNGSDVTFTKADDSTFSEVSSNPSAWNIKIENNKLSIALGNPNKEDHSANFFPEGVNPDGLKIFTTSIFINDNSNHIMLADPNTRAYIWFIYSDKAGIISSIVDYTSFKINFNLNLKAGWNMAIYMQDNTSSDTMTLTTGVPGSNFKWVYSGDDGGINLSPFEGNWLRIIDDDGFKWGTFWKFENEQFLMGSINELTDVSQIDLNYNSYLDGAVRGTFTYTETEIKFIFIEYWDGEWIDASNYNNQSTILEYVIINNILTLTGDGYLMSDFGNVQGDFNRVYSAGEGGDDGSIDFSDAKWSNIEVYNSDGSALYDGSDVTFTRSEQIFMGGDDYDNSFSADSTDPAAWNIKIENNKLSIALGIPDKAEHSKFIPESINPGGLKVVIYNSFSDDNGRALYLVGSSIVWFAHADKAGIISGSVDSMNYNLNIKAGWNIILSAYDELTGTITTGIPDSSYKWCFVGD